MTSFEIDPKLKAFVEDEALPGTGIDASAFWSGFQALLRDLTPENERLLTRRDELQALIYSRKSGLNGQSPSPDEEEPFLL